MSPLYHYCSNAAFHAIVSQRTVWLSSLSLSNDSMEGRLVAEILARLAKADNLGAGDALRIEQAVQDLHLFIDGLGFCLSEAGDLLSQWRAYAADASGVSIGFSKHYLEDIAEASRNSDRSGYALHQVEYDPRAQEQMLEPMYRQIKQLVEEGALRYPAGTILAPRGDEEVRHIRAAFSRFSLTVLTLFGHLYMLKSEAFREEREWRLVSYFVKRGDDNCLFRALSDRIIPYREFPLPHSKLVAIPEVVLGPKNRTPQDVVENFMQQNGFPAVRVVRSAAPYR